MVQGCTHGGGVGRDLGGRVLGPWMDGYMALLLAQASSLVHGQGPAPGPGLINLRTQNLRYPTSDLRTQNLRYPTSDLRIPDLRYLSPQNPVDLA